MTKAEIAVRWGLFAIAVFGMAVYTVAIMLTLAQLTMLLLGWSP